MSFAKAIILLAFTNNLREVLEGSNWKIECEDSTNTKYYITIPVACRQLEKWRFSNGGFGVLLASNLLDENTSVRINFEIQGAFIRPNGRLLHKNQNGALLDKNGNPTGNRSNNHHKLTDDMFQKIVPNDDTELPKVEDLMLSEEDSNTLQFFSGLSESVNARNTSAILHVDPIHDQNRKNIATIILTSLLRLSEKISLFFGLNLGGYTGAFLNSSHVPTCLSLVNEIFTNITRYDIADWTRFWYGVLIKLYCDYTQLSSIPTFQQLATSVGLVLNNPIHGNTTSTIDNLCVSLSDLSSLITPDRTNDKFSNVVQKLLDIVEMVNDDDIFLEPLFRIVIVTLLKSLHSHLVNTNQ